MKVAELFQEISNFFKEVPWSNFANAYNGAVREFNARCKYRKTSFISPGGIIYPLPDEIGDLEYVNVDGKKLTGSLTYSKALASISTFLYYGPSSNSDLKLERLEGSDNIVMFCKDQFNLDSIYIGQEIYFYGREFSDALYSGVNKIKEIIDENTLVLANKFDDSTDIIEVIAGTDNIYICAYSPKIPESYFVSTGERKIYFNSFFDDSIVKKISLYSTLSFSELNLNAVTIQDIEIDIPQNLLQSFIYLIKSLIFEHPDFMDLTKSMYFRQQYNKSYSIGEKISISRVNTFSRSFKLWQQTMQYSRYAIF